MLKEEGTESEALRTWSRSWGREPGNSLVATLSSTEEAVLSGSKEWMLRAPSLIDLRVLAHRLLIEGLSASTPCILF